MKNIIRGTMAILLLVVASMADGAVPAMTVTVSDASGKAAFKGATDSKGTFATSKLKPGNYVVQLNSNSAGLPKGSHYAIVVASGKKKVTANSVPGEKFTGGGVALKVDVGPGLNITGQISSEEAGAVNKSGKKMVWIPPMLGSNRPGHWAEEGSAEAVAAKAAGSMSTQDVQGMQSRGISPVSCQHYWRNKERRRII